jgi:MFS family permease
VSAPSPLLIPTGRDLVRDRSVATFLVGASASSVAMFLQAAALGKHLYDLTDSELALGLLGLVEFLPALILLPLTGSAADRFDRRRVAAVALTAEVATALGFLLYAFGGGTSAVPIFVIAALFGTARAFASPAVRSIPPLIAPEHGLPRLIALYTGTWQVGLIVGPAASGFLYDVDTWVPYAASAAGFAISAIAMSTLTPRRPQATVTSGERPTLHHALEGLRFIRSRPVLLGAIALDLFAVLFAGAVALLPAIAEDRLGVGNVGYGWLRAAPGIGGVLVTGLLAARPLARHIGRTLYGAVALFGLMTVVLGVTRNYAVAFGALVVLSGADAVSVFVRTTIVPLATPDRMRGRVAAVENVFVGASNELGAFESGVAATLLGVGPAVTLGGVLTIGVVGLWCVLFPELRDVDRFADIEVAEEPLAPGRVRDRAGPPVLD